MESSWSVSMAKPPPSGWAFCRPCARTAKGNSCPSLNKARSVSNLSPSTLAEAPAKGEKWRCYAVLNVREDAMELFGFASRQERAMFRRLCQVTGVGAKTALGVLSALSLRDLSVAIVTGDVAALSRAPGIGKKTAQRIVLELKDKVEQQDVSAPSGAAPVSAVAGSAEREAQAALQALG